MKLESLVRDRSRLFWVLNIGGWSGYTLTAWLGAFAHEKPEAYYRKINEVPTILALAIVIMVVVKPF